MQRIDIINLGCSKNLVDAENLLTQLRANGVQVSLNPEELTAETVIVNTCGFISDAKEESIDTIVQAAGYTSSSNTRNLIVMGCLSQRYREDLKRELPEVDRLYGVNEIDRIVRDLGFTYQQDKMLMRMHSTSSHYAYLKIAEGCDRNCSFCAIPAIRGKQVSIRIEDLVAQARFLVEHGVKELMLISQELTRYGIDLYGKPSLINLLQQLEEIPGLEWIRLHYTYPNLFGHDLIDYMKQSTKVCHYLDIPFQHFNDEVLSYMRRGHTKAEGLNLIADLRAALPDIALRTTILVGHPGETEAAFQELLEALAEIRFDRLGVFTYSHEEETYAFLHFEDHIDDAEKQARADQVMNLQQEISLSKNEARIGTHLMVIVDRQEGDHYIGRSQFDSPEVDNEVIIDSEGQKLEIGSFFAVNISDASEFDLHAKLSRTRI